jgi:hypothetical protein
MTRKVNPRCTLSKRRLNHRLGSLEKLLIGKLKPRKRLSNFPKFSSNGYVPGASHLYLTFASGLLFFISKPSDSQLLCCFRSLISPLHNVFVTLIDSFIILSLPPHTMVVLNIPQPTMIVYRFDCLSFGSTKMTLGIVPY